MSVFFVRAARALAAASGDDTATAAQHFADAMIAGCEGISRCVVERDCA